MCLFVRDLTSSESHRLSQWLRNPRNGIQMRRSQVMAFSGQGMCIQEIASQLGMNEEYLRELIRAFNEEGFDALRQKPRSGRPPSLTEEEESIVAEIAPAPPQAFGRPFNQWSLRKLQQFLVQKKLIKPVSHNVIRRVLKNRKITYQRTRTWKRSNDPHYDTKKNASQKLYKAAPEGSVVVCFDEFGPVEVRPRPGSAWAHQGHPIRHRATYHRLHGVRYFFAAYDVHEDLLWMHSKRREALARGAYFPQRPPATLSTQTQDLSGLGQPVDPSSGRSRPMVSAVQYRIGLYRHECLLDESD